MCVCFWVCGGKQIGEEDQTERRRRKVAKVVGRSFHRRSYRSRFFVDEKWGFWACLVAYKIWSGIISSFLVAFLFSLKNHLKQPPPPLEVVFAGNQSYFHLEFNVWWWGLKCLIIPWLKVFEFIAFSYFGSVNCCEGLTILRQPYYHQSCLMEFGWKPNPYNSSYELIVMKVMFLS